MHAQLLQSCIQLFVTLWTVAHQAPLSMRFSRKEYWSELLCSSPVDLPNRGIKLATLTRLLHWQADSLPLAPPGKSYQTAGEDSSGQALFPG